ncbi:hypothetical protein L3N51_01641 [Metallosphaera sp. J1]|uniref:hypothetical protein n=1 Tax=Metallosphaera javensis (ex Hofmann et al. 2022) TaxID=99938 RepID=UPI001EDF3945|nr:hypothetical protein [Metallosphaera javensis (ex Hofmann et al. 2022)]MCG3109351.1 hypothetical protein [Metallosphaera javensis (ex Hofmann et al. 2022)]
MINIKREFDYEIKKLEPNIYDIDLQDKGIKGKLVVYAVVTNIYEREDQGKELEDRILVRFNINVGFRNQGERRYTEEQKPSSQLDILGMVKVVQEPFTEYVLEDRTTLRTRYVPTHIYLMEGARDIVGDPVFTIKGSLLVSLAK